MIDALESACEAVLIVGASLAAVSLAAWGLWELVAWWREPWNWFGV